MDEARRLEMRRSSSKQAHACPCGRTVHGNGLAHYRACSVHLEQRGWPVGDATRQAILHRYRGHGAGLIVIETQRRLGRWFLSRRNGGDRTMPADSELLDLIWVKAAEAYDALNRPDPTESEDPGD